MQTTTPFSFQKELDAEQEKTGGLKPGVAPVLGALDEPIIPHRLPYIVIIINELAELMRIAPIGRRERDCPYHPPG